MKLKNFKVRTIKGNPIDDTSFRYDNLDTKQSNRSTLREDRPFSSIDSNKELFELFSSLVNSVKKSKEQPAPSPFRECVEPRDREVVIDPLEYCRVNSLNEKNLKKWIAEVFKKVFSISFNYFSKKEMNFDQAKIFCS